MPEITAAKGQINICLESLNNRGLQPLLTGAAAAATMSLTTQPVSSTQQGVRLVVWVMSAPTSGSAPTITIVGKDLTGATVTEGPITIPFANPAAQSAVVGKWEYVSTHIFASVNASGITTTNLATTGATITIQGAQAGARQVPGVLKTKKKLEKISIQEHRNSLDRHFKRVQGKNICTLDELSQILYPENSVYLAYMLTGSVPTVTTLPGTPTSLLASTAVSGSPLSLTSQPTSPGMMLILTVTGSSATGSVALTGTDHYGLAASETVTMNGNGTNGNGTYYSSLCYSAVAASSLTVTGLTSGSLAVTGVYGWQSVFLPGDIVYSAALEMFTGVDSFILPWSMFEELDVEFGMDKEAKLTSKGIMQDRLVIGDRTTAYLNTSRITALGQPSDLPIVGWQSLFYIDTTAGAAPTTVFGDLLEAKLNFKSPQKPNWTATNSQNFNRVNRGQRESMFSGKIDLTNVLQLEQHRMNVLQYLSFQLLGQPIGGGNNKLWQWTFPTSWDDFEIESTPDKEHVEATVAATPQYDTNLGGSYRLTIINQQPPNYTL
jgi:hypothetical protein